MAAAANWVASRVPVHRRGAGGGRKRSEPTGGSANGTPRKILTPFSDVPWRSPKVVRTTTGVGLWAKPRRVPAAASAEWARKARRVNIESAPGRRGGELFPQSFGLDLLRRGVSGVEAGSEEAVDLVHDVAGALGLTDGAAQVSPAGDPVSEPRGELLHLADGFALG